MSNVFQELEIFLNILKVIDQWGWAYHNVSRDQRKFSRHRIDIARIGDISVEQAGKYDIVYFSSIDLDRNKVRSLASELRARYPKTSIIGGYAAESNLLYAECDLVISVSLRHYYELVDLYPDKPVVWMPECVDTDFFKRSRAYPAKFTVGWAGREFPVKRPHLLNEFKFPLVRKSDWGSQFFKKDRTLDDMVDFYHSISALILVSISECMPRVVLEAMSMALPVVSTNVGSLGVILPKEMLVPPMPENKVMPKINSILNELKHDNKLFESACEHNRKVAEEQLSWKVNMPYWDKLFESVRDSQKALAIGQHFLRIFGV